MLSSNVPPGSELPGDRALWLILQVDGYIQNGGMLHGLETCGSDVSKAALAFRWFGLESVANILDAAVALCPPLSTENEQVRQESIRELIYDSPFDERLEEEFETLQARYYANFDSEAVETAFGRMLTEEPNAFKDGQLWALDEPDPLLRFYKHATALAEDKSGMRVFQGNWHMRKAEEAFEELHAAGQVARAVTFLDDAHVRVRHLSERLLAKWQSGEIQNSPKPE